MSANGFEFYETPAGVVEALLRRVPELSRSYPSTVYEPCAGDLAIARFFPECLTNDIDPSRPTYLHLDATQPEAWPSGWASRRHRPWVVTNPPFSLAEKILPLAFNWATVGVAFLLRLTYLEPCNGRAEWLQEHRDHLARLIIFNPRPSFTRDGKTDSVTTAWMVWTKARVDGTQIDFVTNWRDGSKATLPVQEALL